VLADFKRVSSVTDSTFFYDVTSGLMKKVRKMTVVV